MIEVYEDGWYMLELKSNILKWIKITYCMFDNMHNIEEIDFRILLKIQNKYHYFRNKV